MAGDIVPLESALIEFFSELWINRAKRANVIAYKSHMQRLILNRTGGMVDIGDPHTFKVPRAQILYDKLANHMLLMFMFRSNGIETGNTDDTI